MPRSDNKLGFGYLRLPTLEDGKEIDLETLNCMVDIYMQGDVRYFDTCYTYLDGKSEWAIRESLVKRYPRDSYRLANKLPGYQCKSAADASTLFDEQLERCGVDYFDVYMLHWMSQDHYKIAEDLGQFDFLQRLKEEGKAKSIGFSFHDAPELLDEILTAHPETDYVLLQINYLDWNSAGVQSRRCYETAVRHGKRVIVMEPLKGGTLATYADPVLGLRYCAELPSVELVLSGMSAPSQVADNIKPMPALTDEEHKQIDKIVMEIENQQQIPCTACSYCTASCPQGLPIPQYFKLYNELHRDARDGWKTEPTYDHTAARSKPAAACLHCGRCLTHCPQQIDIPSEMARVSVDFDSRESKQ